MPQKALFVADLFASSMNQSLREDTPCMVRYTPSTGTSDKRIKGKDHIRTVCINHKTPRTREAGNSSEIKWSATITP